MFYSMQDLQNTRNEFIEFTADAHSEYVVLIDEIEMVWANGIHAYGQALDKFGQENIKNLWMVQTEEEFFYVVFYIGVTALTAVKSESMNILPSFNMTITKLTELNNKFEATLEKELFRTNDWMDFRRLSDELKPIQFRLDKMKEKIEKATQQISDIPTIFQSKIEHIEALKDQVKEMQTTYVSVDEICKLTDSIVDTFFNILIKASIYSISGRKQLK